MKPRIPILTIFPVGFVLSTSILLVIFLTGAQPLPEPSIPEVSCQTAEECFRNAVYFLENNPEQWERQLRRFQDVQEQAPESVWAQRAGLRLGLILADRGSAEALRFLGRAQADFPLLRDFIVLQQARVLEGLGKPMEAAELLEELLTLDLSPTFQHDILAQAGLTRYQAEQCRTALPLLREAHLGDYDHRLAARILYAIADCGNRLGLAKESQEALQEVWWRYPESPESEILQEVSGRTDPSWLKWDKTPDLYYQRAVSYMKLAEFEKAIVDLQAFLHSQPTGPSLEKGQLKLAMAYVRLKRYPLAEGVFRTLAEGSSPLKGKATVWLARVYLRQGKGEALLDLRDSLPSSLTPGSRSQISWMCGIWFEDQGNFPASIESYEQAFMEGGSSKTKAESLWRLGWLQYRQGLFDKALIAFHEMEERVRYPGRRQQAQYWRAKAEERLGKEQEAQEGYRRLAEAYPLTYYGQLARQNLSAHRIFSGSTDKATGAEFHLVGERNREEGRMEQWKGGSEVLEEKNAYLNNSHFLRSQEFRQLGLMKEASSELMQTVKGFRSDPDALSDLAIHLMNAQSYGPALGVVRRFFGSQIEAGQLPPSSLLWKVAFPKGYLPNIRSYAIPAVDPYLVAGIIREESLYDPRALSAVGAKGLMQLMPKTASRLAKQLNLPKLRSEDLFNGDLNIRLGVHYVGELLEQYQGNLAYAVAAYNAGPHNVARWIAKYGNMEPDEFVELISFKETRGYVKRVLTSYRAYHHLDPTTCSATTLDMSC